MHSRVALSERVCVVKGLIFKFCVAVSVEVWLRFWMGEYFCGVLFVGVVLSVGRFCELRTGLGLSFDTSLRDVSRSSLNRLRPEAG